MTLTIIIPTYNGGHKIPVLLNALLRQTLKDFEVVIVVDGSTDNTLEMLSVYEGKFNSFKVLFQENAGRSKVRNRGAQQASGDHFVFYDDDMEPDNQSVQRHVEFHQNHPNSIVGGNALELSSPDKSDFQNYKAWLTQKWIEPYGNGATQLHVDDGFLTAANMSVPRKIFDLLNGFDERLIDAEDQDLAIRALVAHIPVYFDKTNVAVHLDAVTCRKYINRIRQYRVAHKRLALLNPNFRSAEPSNTEWRKRAVYRLFAFKFWPKAVDSSLLIFLPKRLRFKIYSVIVHALGNVYPQVKI